MSVLELALELAVSGPGAGDDESAAGSDSDLSETSALPATMLLNAAVEHVCDAEVMTSVLVRRIKVEQVNGFHW
jgi:hypothetical protein